MLFYSQEPLQHEDKNVVVANYERRRSIMWARTTFSPHHQCVLKQAFHHSFLTNFLIIYATACTTTMFDRAIAKGNWKRPLDLSIPCTYQGELLVPFSRYVYPLNPTTSEMSFTQYIQLPVELQLRIFHFCDQPSLFQLMHTSRDARSEAKKLFFSHPDTWYSVEKKWLLAGGYASHTIIDLDFLACAEQIYVDFGWMHERTWMTEEGSNHWGGTEEDAVATAWGGMNETMQRFWRTVRRCLPRAKHIILGDDQDRSDYHDYQLPPNVYRKVGQMCPSDIRVSVDLVQGDGSIRNRMERVLWQLTSTQKDASAEASQEWKLCPTRNEPIVTPPRRAFHGPVGKFLEQHTLWCDIRPLKRAIRIHHIIATEKIHFDGLHEPFACPASDCDAYFDQAEEYTTHVIATKHDRKDDHYQYDLPSSIKKLFAENQERLDHLTAVSREKEDSFLEWWGKPGSEEARAAEIAFKRQLEHDPLYAQAPNESVEEHHLLHRALRDVKKETYRYMTP